MTPRAVAIICALAALPGVNVSGAFAQGAPEIQILPPDEAQPAPQPPPPEATQTPIPVPAQRDQAGAVVEAPERSQFLTLRPAVPLPRRVVMGPSLPEPGIVRLTGEVAEGSFQLNLPDGVPSSKEVVLSIRSSIDILPDTAVMQVRVNDAAPVDLPLRNFQGFGALRVPAPALQPGTNRIAISLRQPHRIFCGPDASFQSWTEVELSRSGVELAVDAVQPGAEIFSLMVGNQISAGLPVNLLVDQSADPATVRDLSTALGQAMQGRGQVEIRSFYAPGTAASASVALISSDQSRVTYRRDAAGAPVLQVETANGVLPDLSEALVPGALGTAVPVPMLAPGGVHDLEDIGSGDIVGNTHYFRRDLAFRLPDNWLLLANQKAHLSLHYGFAADLPKGAMMLVKINDETVRLLPLDRDGGKLLDPLAIPFAARLLHPGHNKLSFEMMVPGNPADAACAPRRTDMLVVTRDTTLAVPEAPAMRLVGITTQLSALDPRAIGASPVATEARRLELLAAQLAASLVPAEAPDERVRLELTDISGLPQSGNRVSPRVLQEALFPATPTEPGEPVATPTEPSFRLTEEEAQPQQPRAASDEEATGGFFSNWFARQRERVTNAAFMTSDDELGEWLEGRKGDALLMSGSADEPDTMQLVLGPGARINAIGAALNALRGAWLGEGKAVLISNDGTWQVWSSADLPRMEGAVTPLNLLPVLGNYASWSPFLFTAGLLTLGLISVVPALIIVILFRKRRMR